MRVYVNGIGIAGPGLCGWKDSRTVLLGEGLYDERKVLDPIPTILQPNELRRSSEVVRWSLHAAQEAMQHAQIEPKDVATVFASSGGETEILHQICSTLTTNERAISPTLFHHSVHNAAAGYWSIGVHSQQPSTSLSCYDSSFCGGLLEAGTLVCSYPKPVLLVSYDIPPPQPLFAARPLTAPFAMAFLLSSSALPQSFSILRIQLHPERIDKVSTMKIARLESLRVGNPAARALPVLTAIAIGTKTTVFLDYLDDHQISIDITPCRFYPE